MNLCPSLREAQSVAAVTIPTVTLSGDVADPFGAQSNLTKAETLPLRGWVKIVFQSDDFGTGSIEFSLAHHPL